MVSDLVQLDYVAQTVVSCVDVVYKVGSLFLFPTSMIVIDFAALQGSRRILQRNERHGRKHQNPSWPAGEAEGSSKIRGIA